jgi:large subunit ribosomal protein L9
VTAAGFTVDRQQIVLDRPIKTLGMHRVRVMLHPEVGVTVTANVAQSEEAARLQAAGINPLAERDDQDEQQPPLPESAAAEPSA